MRIRVICICTVLGLMLTACSATESSEPAHVAPVTVFAREEWFKPEVHSTWQWQLNGKVNTLYEVDIYIIDLFDTPKELIDHLHGSGRKVICYLSAGSYEDWRPDASRYAPGELGKTLHGYANERWVDIRSSNVRQIVLARMDLAVSKGCDGVEPDNVDGYRNDTGFALQARHQLAFNIDLANAAHARGLAIALKNDLDQIEELLPYFDFAINESCHQYRECDQLMPFIASGKPVFNAEYERKYVTSARHREKLCTDGRLRNFRTLVVPLELNDAYRYSCDP